MSLGTQTILIRHLELEEFQRITEKFVAITDALSQRVEQQKMRTIGVQTALKSMTKQRANQQQELQVQNLL